MSQILATTLEQQAALAEYRVIIRRCDKPRDGDADRLAELGEVLRRSAGDIAGDQAFIRNYLAAVAAKADPEEAERAFRAAEAREAKFQEDWAEQTRRLTEEAQKLHENTQATMSRRAEAERMVSLAANGATMRPDLLGSDTPKKPKRPKPAPTIAAPRRGISIRTPGDPRRLRGGL